MQTDNRTLPLLVFGGLGLVFLLIAGAFTARSIRNSELAPDRPLPVLSQVSDFVLTNQVGQTVTRENLLGQVWIADIIFTRCPGPCVFMTQRMRDVQEALPADLPVKLVSLTTDPDYDSPEVLRDYGKRFGADSNRWWFLTGPKADIVRLAVDNLKLILQEKDPEARESPNDLFIHSSLLVVVDQKGQLRASFESMPRDADPAEEDEATTPLQASERFQPARDEIIRTARFLAQDDRLLRVKDLPTVNACLNGLSALFLLLGFRYIRKGDKISHQRCMLAAVGTSTLFLVSYLTYHAFVGHTVFEEPAWARPWYLALLASHVLLAVVIVPLVLMTLFRAFRQRFDAHKKIARWTWPLWMYVSVTGVLIYFILYWIFPQG